MLDIKVVRNDPQAVAEALAKKRHQFPVDSFLQLDARRKDADVRSQNLLAERKSASKKIGELVASGLTVDDAKAQVATILEQIARDLDEATAAAKEAQDALEALLLETPNMPDRAVPEGDSEDDNQEVLVWGTPRAFDFQPLDHVDIGEKLGQLDAAMAGKITGTRFSVMQGSVARLHRALIQFMLDQHTQHHGYTEVYVPYLVNRDSLLGTGNLPKFEEDLFKVPFGERHYYLIPTAEVPVTNLVRDEIVDAD
ncbi:MAG: serine--tRNA ligase, partial [Luminiphilus sp.]